VDFTATASTRCRRSVDRVTEASPSLLSAPTAGPAIALVTWSRFRRIVLKPVAVKSYETNGV